MTILIANIGTSDLAVKIDDHYIPIGFNRDEPNLDRAEAELKGKPEEKIWQERKTILEKQLYPELGLKFDRENPFSFREVTRRIYEKYQKNPVNWGKRLRPGRILGAIQKAKDQFGVREIYIFVTDHSQFVTDLNGEQKENPGYRSDSFYLFEILKLWFAQKFGEQNISLKPVYISQKVPAIDLDGLLNEYYKFFIRPELQRNEQILISVKGGTPQMQTALRVQAISSNSANQIYLEPRLSIKKLLAGEGSDCQIISYWRYQRIQKYQAVKQLLERWDFDGARTLLEEWEKTLHSFSQQSELGSDPELLRSQEIIEALIKALNMAVGYFNLDPTFARENCDSEQLKALESIVNNYPHQPGEENRQYPKLLNLYTQCCIFWNTDRIADFLSRLGVLYEETMHELIYAFEGDRYFDRPRDRGDWILNTKKLLDRNKAFAQRFYELEKEMGKENSRELKLEQDLKKNNCLAGDRWERPLNFKFKLPGRLTKRNFLRALLETHRSRSGKMHNSAIKSIVKQLQSLDYWCLKRNKLIHGAKGISKQRMKDVLEEDRKYYQQQQPKGAWIDYDIQNSIARASEPNHLPEAITEVSRLTLELMGTSLPRSPMYNRPNYLDSENEPYYIYSELRDWVRQTLDRDL